MIKGYIFMPEAVYMQMRRDLIRYKRANRIMAVACGVLIGLMAFGRKEQTKEEKAG